MISFLISFLVFVVVLVIVGLIIQWALARLGWAVDPTLKAIVGLIVFLVLLLVFLNYAGVWGGAATPFWRH